MNMSRRIGLLNNGKRLLQLNVTKCDCLDCWKRFKPSGMRKRITNQKTHICQKQADMGHPHIYLLTVSAGSASYFAVMSSLL